MDEVVTVIYFDGAAEPTNPGPASAAAIIDLPTGESLTVTVDLGVQTNNVAEFVRCVDAFLGLQNGIALTNTALCKGRHHQTQSNCSMNPQVHFAQNY